MNEQDQVSMKEAADNVILLDDAVFERIVHVLVKVLQSNDYPEERRTILNAIDYARHRQKQEMQEQYFRQQTAMQRQAVNIKSNTGSGLQNSLNPYSNTASTQSIQDQLNYQKTQLDLHKARWQLEQIEAASQLTPSILDKSKFW